MQQIFTEQHISVGEIFEITGEDVRHITQVLRMKAGEQLRASTKTGDSFLCEMVDCGKNYVKLKVIKELPSTELKQKIYLFQAIPKGDRMETVIEKAVELGVYEIIPVQMKYCVVKLDEKKKQSRLKRYQAISEAAAKQSKRSRIPKVHEIMTFAEAIAYAAECEVKLVPYEAKEGMQATYRALQKVKHADSVSVIIGPEGGFAAEEIAAVKDNMDVISLGKRILRTDTAAVTTMSMLMLACELD